MAGTGGTFDAATFDAMAMGLFAPGGRIGRATTTGLERLRVASGPGWARNDDRRDHAGRTDLSPWGSEYDSAEWVITDLRGSMVLRAQGNTTRADAVLDWVTNNAAANAGIIPETFDETTGAWNCGQRIRASLRPRLRPNRSTSRTCRCSPAWCIRSTCPGSP